MEIFRITSFAVLKVFSEARLKLLSLSNLWGVRPKPRLFSAKIVTKPRVQLPVVNYEAHLCGNCWWTPKGKESERHEAHGIFPQGYYLEQDGITAVKRSVTS
jgi:hypothetical protein